MPATSADQPLLTSRKAAAQWWLDTARQAARTITDASTPSSVLVSPDGEVQVDGSPRTAKRKPRALKVPKAYLAALAGTDDGVWRAAHAVAASRWPTRRDSIPGFTIVLTLMAVSIAATTGTGGIPAVAGWLAAAACGALAVLIAVKRRRTTIDAVQTSDRQATRIAGIDAARTVLGADQGPTLYKTALHQWWAGRDPLDPGNRLARLEAAGIGAHGADTP